MRIDMVSHVTFASCCHRREHVASGTTYEAADADPVFVGLAARGAGDLEHVVEGITLSIRGVEVGHSAFGISGHGRVGAWGGARGWLKGYPVSSAVSWRASIAVVVVFGGVDCGG